MPTAGFFSPFFFKSRIHLHGIWKIPLQPHWDSSGPTTLDQKLSGLNKEWPPFFLLSNYRAPSCNLKTVWFSGTSRSDSIQYRLLLKFFQTVGLLPPWSCQKSGQINFLSTPLLFSSPSSFFFLIDILTDLYIQRWRLNTQEPVPNILSTKQDTFYRKMISHKN